MGHDDITDIEELKEVMKVLSETVPGLLESINKVLYNREEGENYGKAVASFYSALKEAGMDNEQAYKLTREYMSSMSMGGLLSNITGAIHKDRDEDDIGDALKKRIKKEIMED
jgi:hypothetical protein